MRSDRLSSHKIAHHFPWQSKEYLVICEEQKTIIIEAKIFWEMFPLGNHTETVVHRGLHRKLEAELSNIKSLPRVTGFTHENYRLEEVMVRCWGLTPCSKIRVLKARRLSVVMNTACWRHQNHEMATKDGSRCGAELVWAFETQYGCCGCHNLASGIAQAHWNPKGHESQIIGIALFTL